MITIDLITSDFKEIYKHIYKKYKYISISTTLPGNSLPVRSHCVNRDKQSFIHSYLNEAVGESLWEVNFKITKYILMHLPVLINTILIHPYYTKLYNLSFLGRV